MISESPSPCRGIPTCLHKAKESTKQELKREAHKHFTGQDYEPYEMVCFKLYESQLPVILRAHVASRMAGTEKSRGYCLGLVCAGFSAGQTDEATPEEILRVISRLIEILPAEYRPQSVGFSEADSLSNPAPVT